jgi:23S rRNA pseudouridine2605 synthase
VERLQKTLAHAGISSRRKCEEMILARRVRVNGKIVAELGTQVDPARDRIEVDGEAIQLEKKIYLLLHKPRGYLSDYDERRGKPLALDLVPAGERLYAAGRLDANSEGLLLLTNDGDLAHQITHPRYQHEKEYLALVEGEPSEDVLARMQKGICFDGERMRADHVRVVRQLGEFARKHNWNSAGRGECWLRIILHEGKKREIRHLCAEVGHPVKRLIRVRIGPIVLGGLPVGESRELSFAEVQKLKNELRKNQVDSASHPSSDINHSDRRPRRIR